MNEMIWLAVTLCMSSHILNGVLYLYPDERLLDILNGTPIRRVEHRSRVLALSDVTIYKSDGKEDKLPTVYVNKRAVLLAATWDRVRGRGAVSGTGQRSYPFVEKLAVPTRLQVSGFSIAGNMHCAQGQMACHLLDESVAFLPVTDATVHPLNDIWSQVPFVAVNREQVLSLQQEDIPLLQVEFSNSKGQSRY